MISRTLFAAVLGWLLAWEPAGAVLGIDGTPNSIVLRPGSSANIPAITTSNSGDVVIICGYGVGPTGGAITGITGAGLTFTKRSQIIIPAGFIAILPNDFVTMECQWAEAPSPLVAVSFTVNYSVSFTEITSTVWAISGSTQPSAPWDPNIALPAYANDQSGSLSNAQVSVSTSNLDDDMLLWFCDAANGGAPDCGVPAGFTPIVQGGASYTSYRYAFKLVSGPQTALVLTNGAPTYWDVIGDAIMGTVNLPGPTPNTPRRPFLHGWPW